MNDSFATKSDIALIRGDIALAVSRIEKHEELTKAEFAPVRTEMIALENRLVVKLGGLMVTLFSLWTAVFTWVT